MELNDDYLVEFQIRTGKKVRDFGDSWLKQLVAGRFGGLGQASGVKWRP